MQEEARAKIEKTIKNIHQLPTLPVVYNKLTKLISNPKTTAQEVSNVIEDDQALTTKVLKIVNSAFYGFPQRVSTISRSIVILGFNEVRNIAFSCSLIKNFGSKSSTDLFNRDAFWLHALAVGACARIIGKRLSPSIFKMQEEVFVAGLIHDIGKIIEDQFMNEDFARCLERVQNDHIPLIKSEDAIFGFNHQEVGQLLAEKWNLPKNLITVIGYHDTPAARKGDAEIFPMIAVVHLANIIVRALGIGSGGDHFVPAIQKDAWECLDLRKSHIELIMDETGEACEELAAMGLTT